MEDKDFQIDFKILVLIIAMFLGGVFIFGGFNISNDSNNLNNESGTVLETQELKFNFVSNNDMNVSDVTQPEVLSAEELAGRKSIIATTKGEVEIELFGDEAPLAVSNHIGLINQGFYDNIVFHRREEGFVIQVGDPMTKDESLRDLWGTGGPGYRFQDEPVTRSYERGIVAMANAGPNTNGSQFFIMLGDTPLPPSYTVFGVVTSGMDVVDQIQVGDKILSARVSD